MKIQKKIFFEGGGRAGSGLGGSRGVRSGIGVWEVGLARFGVGGGCGGCKQRIKGIDKCK